MLGSNLISLLFRLDVYIATTHLYGLFFKTLSFM